MCLFTFSNKNIFTVFRLIAIQDYMKPLKDNFFLFLSLCRNWELSRSLDKDGCHDHILK